MILHNHIQYIFFLMASVAIENCSPPYVTFNRFNLVFLFSHPRRFGRFSFTTNTLNMFHLLMAKVGTIVFKGLHTTKNHHCYHSRTICPPGDRFVTWKECLAACFVALIVMARYLNKYGKVTFCSAFSLSFPNAIDTGILDFLLF